MIDPEKFYNCLIENGIEFFTGVPDSLLKHICAFIADNAPKEKNIIAANEGGAIALASGYYLASGKTPLVYMQNSGIGNTVNPILSLANRDVYSIPLLMMIGWRGEPGLKDEPQHLKQGKVTLGLLDAMEIPYEILPTDYEESVKMLKKALDYIDKNIAPFALIIRKGTFEPYELKRIENTNFELTREQAIKEVVQLLDEKDIVVSTTGMISRELFEFRDELSQGHEKDFLTVGSMGHANQIALGIALEKPRINIYCFDGDGAILMHSGSLSIIGDMAPSNFKHILFNNGAHDSVGGQPTVGFKIDFTKIAKASNYKFVAKVDTVDDLKKNLREIIAIDGPAFLEIRVNKGARKDLGRPTTSPIENKIAFMENLKP